MTSTAIHGGHSISEIVQVTGLSARTLQVSAQLTATLAILDHKIDIIYAERPH
jgi:hypothetical protein